MAQALWKEWTDKTRALLLAMASSGPPRHTAFLWPGTLAWRSWSGAAAHNRRWIPSVSVINCQLISYLGSGSPLCNILSQRWADFDKILFTWLNGAYVSLVKDWTGVIKSLDEIASDEHQPGDTRHEALCLRDKLDSLETALMVTIWGSILETFKWAKNFKAKP